MVVTRQFTSTEEKQGCFTCNASRCGICPIIQERPSITIQSTGQKFIIKKEATCRTDNVLYILTCSGCGEQYVGETCMMLTRRITLHRQHINTPQYRILGVNRYIAECVRANVSVTRV